MKIAELKEVLSQYPDTAEVLVTWEGIFESITTENIYQSPAGVIVIDADNNHYKAMILSGELIAK